MNVLLTGANGNLGKAVAKTYLDAGHHVYGTMLPNNHEESLEQHDHFTRWEIDLMHEGPLAEQLAALEQPIHAAVCTVGGFAMGSLADTTLEDLDKMIRLNLHTAFVSAKAAFAHMQAHGGGRLVFIGARPGLDPSAGAGTLAYTLSKTTIPALADMINEQGKDHNIVASIVAPSLIDTPPNRSAMPDADVSKWVTPEEIAEVIYFATTKGGRALRQPIFKVYGES